MVATTWIMGIPVRVTARVSTSVPSGARRALWFPIAFGVPPFDNPMGCLFPVRGAKHGRKACFFRNRGGGCHRRREPGDLPRVSEGVQERHRLAGAEGRDAR